MALPSVADPGLQANPPSSGLGWPSAIRRPATLLPDSNETKIESKANKYTLVWRKTGDKNRAKLQEKMRVLLQQIDEEIVKDEAAESEVVESTPEALT